MPQRDNSTVDMRVLAPTATTKPYSELEYLKSDPLNDGNPSVTWWTGEGHDNCEAEYEIVLKRQQKGATVIRTKQFEIPSIPYKFIVVNDKLYYRRNVE